jgi:hypothetical protein
MRRRTHTRRDRRRPRTPVRDGVPGIARTSVEAARVSLAAEERAAPPPYVRSRERSMRVGPALLDWRELGSLVAVPVFEQQYLERCFLLERRRLHVELEPGCLVGQSCLETCRQHRRFFRNLSSRPDDSHDSPYPDAARGLVAGVLYCEGPLRPC